MSKRKLETFGEYLEAIGTEDIRVNLKHHFPGDLEKAELALTIDLLLGAKLEQIDKRLDELTTDTNRAFGALFTYFGVKYDRTTGVVVDDEGTGLMAKLESLESLEDKMNRLLDFHGLKSDDED